MTTNAPKPIALHLAEQNEAEGRIDTAAELRRQHQAIVELREALKKCAAVCAGETTTKNGLVDALEVARASLTKHQEH